MKKILIGAFACACTVGFTLGLAACGQTDNGSAEHSPVGQETVLNGSVLMIPEGFPADTLGEDGDVCFVTENGDFFRKKNGTWSSASIEHYDILENDVLSITFENGQSGNYQMTTLDESSSCDHAGLAEAETQVVYESFCVVPGIGVKYCPSCHTSYAVILPANPEKHDLHDFSYAGETVQKCSFCSYSPDHGYLYEVEKDSSLTEVFEQAEQNGTVILGDDKSVTEEDMLEVGENKDLTLDVNGNTMTVVKENEEAASGHQGLTVGKGGSLTITDSTASAEVSGSGVFIVDYKTVNGNRDSHEDGDYGLTVEGTLNVEGVKFQVNNETSDHSVYVDGGTVNFSDGAEIKMNGKTTASSVEGSTHLEDYGFGIGIYIGNGGSMKIENTTINAEGNITPFMVGFGTSEDKSELYLGEGTNLVWKNPFNLNGVTVASALQVYTNGVLTVDKGATITLEGDAKDPNKYGKQDYTFVYGINCVGGGEVTMNGTLNLSLEKGITAGVMVTTNYTRDAEGAVVGLINDTHVTIGSSAKINAVNPQSGYFYFFVAQRNGTQQHTPAKYQGDPNLYYGELHLAEPSHSVTIENGAKIFLENQEVLPSNSCFNAGSKNVTNLDEYAYDAVLDNRVIEGA